MPVDVVIEDARWQGARLEALSAVAGDATLAHLGLSPEAFEIVVMGCDDARIATLNADFRGKPQPTNVLSWPEEDLSHETVGTPPRAPHPGNAAAPEPLGDIAIAFDTCQREAAEQGKPLSDHVTHLLVHGILHLLGYDHIRDADATLMEGLEVEILGNLGLSDPYT